MGKARVEKEKREKKKKKNAPSFCQTLGAFLQNKSVSGSSFG